MNKLYFDGKITESINDFDIFNRGFKYNDSFFETIHVTNGKVFNVKNHLIRIVEAVKILKFNFKYTSQQLVQIFNDLISVNNLKHGVLRLYIYRNSDGQYLPNNNDTSLIIKTNHLNCSFKINSPKNYVLIIGSLNQIPCCPILRLIQLFQYYLQFMLQK